MERIQFTHAYEHIISMENLLGAWQEFSRDKGKRKDVQEFKLRLMDNLFSLHADLRNRTYRHGPYEHFRISDPKPRDIHKATVRDRVVHRALYRKLYPFFDRVFISDSFSCRLGKGTHRGFNRFRVFARLASRNHTKTCSVLKCDIRKFFANIDHDILFSILKSYIADPETLGLLQSIISSFFGAKPAVGLPLGNLTSQLLVNIYMNEFDQFVKHRLKAKYYIRYADDFVILSRDRQWLLGILIHIRNFLSDRLYLELHPDKVFIKTFASGVDFLGWVHFSDHRVLRTATRRRMFRAISGNPTEARVASYLGMLGHGNARKLQEKVLMLSSRHDEAGIF